MRMGSASRWKKKDNTDQQRLAYLRRVGVVGTAGVKWAPECRMGELEIWESASIGNLPGSPFVRPG